VVEGYTIHGIMNKHQPDLPLVLLNGTKKGFEKLLSNEIDVFLVNMVTANYFINQARFKNLKLAYKTNHKLNLKVAIRNDWPAEVISIINKSLDSITEKELSDIYDKWTVVTVTTRVDYDLLYEVAAILVVLILLIIVWNRKLNSLVKVKTKDIESQKQIVESQKQTLEELLSSFDKYVIASKTDKKGRITYASQAFCEISGYEHKELIGKTHSIVRHPDMPKEVYADLWKTITSGQTWQGEIKNRNKAGGFYWVDAIISPEYDNEGKITNYSAIRHDITAKKEVEDLSKNLEEKVKERTQELDITMTDLKKQSVIAQEAEEKTRLLLTSVGEGLFGVGVDGLVNFINPAALQMLQYQEADILNKKIHPIIHHTYADGSPYPVEQCPMFHAFSEGKISEIDDEVLWRKDGSSFPVEYQARPVIKNGKISGSVVNFRDIRARKTAHDLLIKQQAEIEEINRHTKESIEYAALIQSALVPDNQVFKKYFKDFFAIWHPKDIVGGDIYLVEEISPDELLLMVIDCTGHGVPGAFVTMLVKAVERQITANLPKEKEISPAKMLRFFNASIKHLLKQEDKDSLSNAGFDGGILYYNKKQKVMRFSGAETPLFIIQGGEIQIIKGNRQSIGYKKSDANYEFTDHTIDVSQPTQIYLSTDGYIDQNGGEKGFSFGKRRFTKLLLENANESFADQQELLLYELQNYQKDNQRNDDVTIVGIKI